MGCDPGEYLGRVLVDDLSWAKVFISAEDRILYRVEDRIFDQAEDVVGGTVWSVVTVEVLDEL